MVSSSFGFTVFKKDEIDCNEKNKAKNSGYIKIGIDGPHGHIFVSLVIANDVKRKIIVITIPKDGINILSKTAVGLIRIGVIIPPLNQATASLLKKSAKRCRCEWSNLRSTSYYTPYGNLFQSIFPPIMV